LVPCVRVTSVLPTLRLLNMLGALTSYQSFFENGSTLRPQHSSISTRAARSSSLLSRGISAAKRVQAAGEQGAHVFFFPPFLPLEMRLFLPTAMAAGVAGRPHNCTRSAVRHTAADTWLPPSKPISCCVRKHASEHQRALTR